MRIRILLIYLLIACMVPLHAAERSDEPGKTKVYQGFSGGMMVGSYVRRGYGGVPAVRRSELVLPTGLRLNVGFMFYH